MKKTYQHTIDFLFPISLFFVFSAAAFVVLLMAANIYQNLVTDSNTSFEQETAFAYITGKIRQNDTGGTEHIYLGDFDGHEALAIEQNYDGGSYITYIYVADGALKEIFLQEGTQATATSGTTILPIDNLEMEKISDGLFQFTCTAADGTTDSVMVGVRSRKE